MSVNKAILLGRIGQNPEVKIFDGGGQVTKFSLATSERFKDRNGEKQEKTEWHNVVAFGKLAEIFEKYLNKGDEVYIEGKIATRSWEDKDGQKRYMTEIVAQSFSFVGGAKSTETNQAAPSQPAPGMNGPDDDDLPW